MSDVTRILSQIELGDPTAAERLLPLVYDELRKLAAARPKGVRGGFGSDVTVRQALDAAEARVPVTFKDRPRAEAVARHGLGVTFRLIGEFGRAESNLQRALALRKESLGDDHEDPLDSQNSLAVLLTSLGKHAEAVSWHEQAVRRQMAKPGADDSPITGVCVHNLACRYGASGQFHQAIMLWEDAFARRRRLAPPTTVMCLAS